MRAVELGGSRVAPRRSTLPPWLQEVNDAGLPLAVLTEEPVLAVGQAEGELQTHPCLGGLPVLTPVPKVQVPGCKLAGG